METSKKMTNLFSLIKLLRPQQWAKNTFIFLPVFFGAELLNYSTLQNCLLAFLGFSFIASSIYSFNDINDVELDRLHPEKKNRPIASGKVSILQGYVLMTLSLFIGFAILILGKLSWEVPAIAGTYFLLNIAYTIKLKQYAIVDVSIIAMGFIFRLLIGSYASGVELSKWIIIMTYLLALFLAFAKRRDEYVIYKKEGLKSRKNIARYNEQFLDIVISILGTIIIVAYINYSVSIEAIANTSENLYFTSFFVILGILRYLQKTIVDKQSGNPTKVLLKDRFIQLCLVAWVGSFIFFIYVN